MDDKIEFENNITIKIKSIIISDSALSYGERNSFEKFIVRLDRGESFEEAVEQLLTNFHRLEENQEYSLSPNSKKIYDELIERYGIPEKKETHVFYNGGYRKLSNTQWFWTMLFFTLLIVLAWTGRLNFLFDFLEKYLK
ncbi:hypothetical protein [Lactococcus protaetiae]|uniref:Uncharacterized protein n=1 Tax=Lactococcus protaetiae TaxID=2592653 RepID=A0A514ZAG5_9LACT|nr:hypothetical protein [Lactococcus protaetiae]QDK71576.1 hypothetical protein FLP15_10890 [Lactococcus protaetiae]